jgi:alpha-glucosidase (family GH31 glycosyl hydrolase)
LRAVLGALLVAAALALLAAQPATAAPVLRSGALELRIREDPFELALVDRADGDVLRTVSARSGRYGPLGYSFDLRIPIVNNAFLGYELLAKVETVWFHATRVRSAATRGRELVLELETNDPLGHRLELTAAPVAEGAITLSSRMVPGSGPLAGRASVSGASFEAARGERYLGFGSRSNAVDQTGGHVFSWAEEGPFSSGAGEALLRPLLPHFTFPTGPTGTNMPIPWMVSTRGLGVLVDQTERSTFHLRDERPDAWRAEADAAVLRLTAFAGPDPARVLRRYSAYAGRQPRPQPWILGPWVQFRDDWAERFRRMDVPTSIAQTYTHYLPCGAHRGREAAERATVARHHRLGYRITTYFNPHVCTDYSEVYDDAARRGLFVRNGLGRPYLLTNPFTADQIVSELDFTNPEARALFGRLLDDAIGAGYDGWMEDFGEYTPTDSFGFDGRRGLSLHNAYPVLYHRTSTEHTARRRGGRFAVFVRSGFHGVQRWARVVWGGDPTEDWSCADGLCAALHQALNTGLSGIAYQGSDIGGFHAIANGRTTDELNARWLQLGAVSGVMRTQANGLSVFSPRSRRSQVWSPAVLPIWRRYAKLRTQLYPYLAAASERYQRDGMPLVRQLGLVFPDDPAAVRSERELMLGPDLLAAPVVEERARTRTLHLPPGRWVDLWRSAGYSEAGGDLRVGRARVLAGGRAVTLPAPLAELPLLVRAGAVIPLLPPDVDTLADLDEARGVVQLRDRRRRLTLLAFPRGSLDRVLAPGVRVRAREHRRGWDLRLRARRTHSYRLTASLATLRRRFRPCHVTLRGRPLARRAWRYDATTRVLRARFRVRDGRLAVRACRPVVG